MALTYLYFDPQNDDTERGGPTKTELLEQIERNHWQATNAGNQRRIARLERIHGIVLNAANPRAARRAFNEAIIADEAADRQGPPRGAR